MANLKKFLCGKAGWIVASLALMIGASTMNAACMFWFHQPKVPQGMEKFKRH